MLPKLAILLVLASSVALVGCERLQSTFGIGKISPNPLRVIRQDPLAVPPNLELRPPLTVAAAGSEPAVTPTAGEGAAASRGEAAMLDAAATHDVDPQIRQLLERDRALKEAEEEDSGGLLGLFDVFGWFDDDEVEYVSEAPPPAQPETAAETDAETGAETDTESDGGRLLDWLDIFDWFGDDE